MQPEKTSISASSTLRIQFLLLFFAIALFVAANFNSYRGFFKVDDFDTLRWTPFLNWSEYVKAYFSWRFQPNNFRPVAHFYYHLMNACVNYTYWPWVLVVQTFVLTNVAILWLLLRRLGFGLWAAAAGCVLLLLHPSLFDAYWKPMYVFDVTCGLFSLLALYCYVSNRWILSLIAFYTAYRCKEMAIMLPLVLALYEFWFGKRAWKRLIPFLALSLSFGIQAVLHNSTAPKNDYSMTFGTAVLARTAPFYARAALGFSWSVAVVLGATLLGRDKRGYFGFLSFCVLLAPLLFLPGRLFSVYLYVPMVGLCITVAATIDTCKRPRPIALGLLIAWLLVGLYKMSGYSATETMASAESRTYVDQVSKWLRTHPSSMSTDYIYDALPDSMDSWSVKALLTNLTHNFDVRVTPINQSVSEASVFPPGVYLGWDPHIRRLTAVSLTEQNRGYLQLSDASSQPQLLAGWYRIEDGFRWTMPEASARLYGPSQGVFRAVFFVPTSAVQSGAQPTIEVFLDHQPLGRHPIQTGLQEVKWPVKRQHSGPVTIRFVIVPTLKAPPDVRDLGVAMVSFGFLP